MSWSPLIKSVLILIASNVDGVGILQKPGLFAQNQMHTPGPGVREAQGRVRGR